MSKIVLKGFYGFRNFGDDILMIAAYEIVRNIFPGSEICINSERNDATYISRLLGRAVPLVSSSTDLEAEWIIHGGGGVFFDFNRAGQKFWLLNKLIRYVGYNSYSTLFQLISRTRRKRWTRTKYRAGLGIGLGSYTPSSAKFYTDILALSDFDFLIVRDAESFNRAAELGLRFPMSQATDLAFLHEYWVPGLGTCIAGKNVVGLILRDWHFDNSAYLAEVSKVAFKLKEAGYVVNAYSFDGRSDRRFIETFSKDFSITVWNPDKMSVDDFLTKLRECQIVVSSRAHGCIVSACLGIPSVCLAIEPKLQQVHGMLKNCTILVDSITTENVLRSIQNAFAGYGSLQEGSLIDIKANREVMQKGIAIFKEFVRNVDEQTK